MSTASLPSDKQEIRGYSLAHGLSNFLFYSVLPIFGSLFLRRYHWFQRHLLVNEKVTETVYEDITLLSYDAVTVYFS